MKNILIALSLFISFDSLQSAEGKRPAPKRRRLEQEAHAAAAAAAEPIREYFLTFDDGETTFVDPAVHYLFTGLTPWQESDPEYYHLEPEYVDFSSETFDLLMKFIKYPAEEGTDWLKTLHKQTLDSVVRAADELELDPSKSNHFTCLIAEVFRRNDDENLMNFLSFFYQDKVLKPAKKTAQEIKKLS